MPEPQQDWFAAQAPAQADWFTAAGGATHDPNQPLPTYADAVKQYALGELKGAGKAVLGAVDPRTYWNLGKDVVTQGPNVAGAHLLQGVLRTGQRIAGGDPEAMGEALAMPVIAKAGPAAAEGIANIPGGRILSSGWAGTKAGAAKLPIIGKPAKAFVQGARQSWAESAPGVEAPPSGPMPGRPDLVAAGQEGAYNATQSAPAGASSPTEQAYQRIPENRGRFDPQATQVPPNVPKLVPEGAGPAASGKLRLTGPHAAAQYLRDEFGSEQAGRMLYGKSGVGLPPAERTAAIKRLAPGESRLPNQARRAITQGVQQGSPADAWNYVQDAPNDVAREYLINMMRGRQ